VVLFLPFLGWFAAKVVDFAGEPGTAVAWAQLIFNLAMTFAVLILLRIFERRLALFDSTRAGAAASGGTRETDVAAPTAGVAHL
jgi:Na+/phosphate symporter